MGDKKRFETRAIHAGNKPDESTGAVSPPIHFTSTYQQESVGQHKGFDYSRAANPTRQRYEENLASLEGGKYGIAFASGMAATTALFQTLEQGDHVIIGRNVYGGTYRMAVEILSNHGFQFDFVDTRYLNQIEDAIQPNTKWIFVETPTNPLLELCDIKSTAKLCQTHGIKLAVDNTFMSPYGQNPLALGATLVLHSATKFIGGHSDVIGGALITNEKVLADQLYFIQKSAGAVPSPFDCWMLLRSTKTLALRVQKQSDNALDLAHRLESNSQIRSMRYPGLKSHPQHDLVKKQQLNPEGIPIFGSIISFELESVNARDQFLSKIKLFTLAESLGGVESLVCIPYEMTHGSVPPVMKKKMGLSKKLIRLSVGIEHVDDLYDDITQSLFH
jgi:cystathionine beta-lyase/cystathionine gamma-synthase